MTASDWWLSIAILAMLVAGLPALKRKIAARRVAERLRGARMIRHADEEHALVMQGKLAGVFGDYPTPPELRGIGGTP